MHPGPEYANLVSLTPSGIKTSEKDLLQGVLFTLRISERQEWFILDKNDIVLIKRYLLRNGK